MAELVAPEQLTEGLTRAGGPFSLTVTGLVIVGEPTPDDVQELIVSLLQAQTVLRWSIGDGWNWAVETFGDDAYQVVPDGEEERIMQYARVSSAFTPEQRFEELSWSHHRLVLTLPEDDRDALLSRAVEERWTCARLREELPFADRPISRGRQIEEAALAVWSNAKRNDLGFYEVASGYMDRLGELLRDE